MIEQSSFLKLNIKILILIMGLSSPCSLFAQNIEVQGILNKHAKAIGKDKLDQVKTLLSFGVISQLGNNMEVSILQKRPNKYRMDVHVNEGRISQAYDGSKGWMLNPFVFEDTVEITGMELNQLVESALFDGVLFNAEQLNYQLSYGGEDHIIQGKSHMLILKKPNGDRMKFFIDKDSYLIKRTEIRFMINGFPVEANSVFSDFRNIDGLVLPFKIENNNGQMSTTMLIERVRINETVQDKLFQAPKVF